MSFFESVTKILDRIGVFGRFILAFVPMLIVVMIGIGIGGDEETSLVIRVPVILGSLFVFSIIIFFIQGEE